MDHYRDLKSPTNDKAQLSSTLAGKELETYGLAVCRGAECSSHRVLLKRLVLCFVIGIAILAFLACELLQRFQISCGSQKITGGELITDTTSMTLEDRDKWTFTAYSDTYCQTSVKKSNGTAL